MLDAAESILRATAKRLSLPVEVIRKERACGVVPQAPVIYETLEELALAVQARRLPPECSRRPGGTSLISRSRCVTSLKRPLSSSANFEPSTGGALSSRAPLLRLQRRQRRLRRRRQQVPRPAIAPAVPRLPPRPDATRRGPIHAHGERQRGQGVLPDPLGRKPRCEEFWFGGRGSWDSK